MVLMVQSADHITGATGLTLTVTASKDGGAFGSISPTVTERGNGWYSIALTSSHTDTLGDIALQITAASADPSSVLGQVIAADLNDAVDLGLTNLDATVSSRLAAASYTAPLDAAATRTALGLASANLDTQLDALPTAAEIEVAVNDGVVEGTTTVRQSLRLANAANAGKLSGAATTSVTIRDLADSKDRIAATVDEDGNRTAVVVDVS